MPRVTREEYLDAAERLFADRGFYGVSISAIASELGLTKQALLHHFESKEKLYGQVLFRISKTFERQHQNLQSADPKNADEVVDFFHGIYISARQTSSRTRLLMRELLDNNERAETAGKWYLKPFLKNLISLIQAVPSWADESDASALVAGYQILGAINYYCISEPTLSGIFGSEMVEAFDAEFPGQLRRLITAILETGPEH